jgi:hypothetical protein
MLDPALFGDQFGGESFAAWRALLAGFYGLDLTEDEAATFQALTGLDESPGAACDELWLAVGRRGGKSRAAALVGAFEGAFKDHRAKLAPGEVATVMLVAGDRFQARTLMRYTRGLFENPMLRKMVVRETETGLELTNRTTIEIGTASFRSVRGYTLAAVVADEIAFWHSDGANPDEEVIAALRPALTTLGGKLLALSSPHSKRSVLWQNYARHFGKPGRVLVAQAPSLTMNPTLPRHVVDDALSVDPARARAEYLAEFRSDLESFLAVDQITEAQRSKPLELPRLDKMHYHAFADPSGGGADHFTVSIAHAEGERIVVDLVRGRRGNPAAICGDFSELLKSYGIARVKGDRYAGAWVSTEFARHGIAYEHSDKDRSAIYTDFLAAMNSGRVELPPCQTTARQLISLERRTTRAGKDIIDHPPGGHDDHANAVAGAVAQLSGPRHQPKSQTRVVGGLV